MWIFCLVELSQGTWGMSTIVYAFHVISYHCIMDHYGSHAVDTCGLYNLRCLMVSAASLPHLHQYYKITWFNRTDLVVVPSIHVNYIFLSHRFMVSVTFLPSLTFVLPPLDSHYYKITWFNRTDLVVDTTVVP